MSIVEHNIETTVPAVLDPRVVRGAELLDERMPGWAEKIDLERLRLASTCDCIGGQLGSGDDPYYDFLCRIESPGHRTIGLYTDNGDEWPMLEQDWRLAILSRRTPA